MPHVFRQHPRLQKTDVSTCRLRTLWIAVGAVIALGCSPAQKNAPANNDTEPAADTGGDTLVQFSLLAALAADNYVGECAAARGASWR